MIGVICAGIKKKDVEHVFWNYKVVRSLWKILFPKLNILFHNCKSWWKFKDFWDGASRILDAKDASAASHLIWEIWQKRNNLKQSKGNKDTKQILQDILSAAHRFMIENEWEKTNHGKRSETLPSHGRWIPPGSSQWKLNVDVAWFEASNSSGVGWIVRDSEGSLIGAGSKKTSGRLKIKMLEAMTVVEGFSIVSERFRNYPDCSLHEVVIESDAAEIVRLINGVSKDCSEISLLINEIRETANQMISVSFVHCPRASNFLAIL